MAVMPPTRRAAPVWLTFGLWDWSQQARSVSGRASM
jgi:hypothetical protein